MLINPKHFQCSPSVHADRRRGVGAGQCARFMHFSTLNGGGAFALDTQGKPAESYVPPPRPSDGGRSNGKVGTSDLTTTRVCGVPNTPITETPGSRAAANICDNSRIV